MQQESPKFYENAFNCPFCNAFAQMNWNALTVDSYKDIYVVTCARCKKRAIWFHPVKNSEDRFLEVARKEAIMIYPSSSSAPMPHPDLPDICRADYMEARNIVSLSPRGAAALLRLVLQKLCNHFGSPEKSINDNIAEMVKQGLPESLRKMFDFVRLTGNEAVHPGEMNIQDSPELVHSMFSFINMIAEKMIAEPRQIDEMYGKLPEGKRKATDNRDGRNPS